MYIIETTNIPRGKITNLCFLTGMKAREHKTQDITYFDGSKIKHKKYYPIFQTIAKIFKGKIDWYEMSNSEYIKKGYNNG